MLLEIDIINADLVCPETGRKFPVADGVPNMLLNEDEVWRKPFILSHLNFSTVYHVHTGICKGFSNTKSWSLGRSMKLDPSQKKRKITGETYHVNLRAKVKIIRIFCHQAKLCFNVSVFFQLTCFFLYFLSNGGTRMAYTTFVSQISENALVAENVEAFPRDLQSSCAPWDQRS